MRQDKVVVAITVQIGYAWASKFVRRNVLRYTYRSGYLTEVERVERRGEEKEEEERKERHWEAVQQRIWLGVGGQVSD